MFSITLCLAFAYHLCNAQSIDASDESGEENLSAFDESFDQPKIWSDLLEELTIKLVELIYQHD